MASTPKNAGVPAKKATYTVISPLRHGEVVDGKVVQDEYAPGEAIELTEAQAAPLLGHTVQPPKG